VWQLSVGEWHSLHCKLLLHRLEASVTWHNLILTIQYGVTKIADIVKKFQWFGLHQWRWSFRETITEYCVNSVTLQITGDFHSLSMWHISNSSNSNNASIADWTGSLLLYIIGPPNTVSYSRLCNVISIKKFTMGDSLLVVSDPQLTRKQVNLCSTLIGKSFSLFQLIKEPNLVSVNFEIKSKKSEERTYCKDSSILPTTASGSASNRHCKVSPSATTLVSVRNTRVFRKALRALTEPHTLRRRIPRFPLHPHLLYLAARMWWHICTIRMTRVLHSSEGRLSCWSHLHNTWRWLCPSSANRHSVPLHSCYISDDTLLRYV
jgi:hypothetical protein